MGSTKRKDQEEVVVHRHSELGGEEFVLKKDPDYDTLILAGGNEYTYITEKKALEIRDFLTRFIEGRL